MVNSDDLIGKMTSKSIWLQHIFIFKKGSEVDKKQILSSEKMRNLGNCIYEYAHSLFGEDFCYIGCSAS